MEIVFSHSALERMDHEASFDGEFATTVADEYRHRLQILRSADSEQRLLSLKALDMQQVGGREAVYRIRVTENVRLEVEFRNGENRSDRCVVITDMTPNNNDNKGGLS
jgi:plasmid maintenance system killer protein